MRNHIPYRIDEPTRNLQLADALHEISGITEWSEKVLAAIQDELGTVYLIDKKTGKIKREISFAKNGDFEDVAKVGDELWVLRSDGVLFRIKNLEARNIEVKKYKTALSVQNDVEGLYYHAQSHSLWMACKESPNLSDDKKYKGQRAVYAFDLKKKELKKKPVVTISNKAVRAFLKDKYGDIITQPFKPSALSVRPKDGYIYIVSSTGQTLLVLDPMHEIHDVISLNPAFGPQPESLTFDGQNGLYIASEGKMGKPTLLFYDTTNE